jgi:hypothetical protein
MNKPLGFFDVRTSRTLALLDACSAVLFGKHFYVYGQDKAAFPVANPDLRIEIKCLP